MKNAEGGTTEPSTEEPHKGFPREVTLLAETKSEKDERHSGRDGRGDTALACPRIFINKIRNVRCITI